MKSLLEPKRLAKGLYWNRAWNLVSGCSPVSEGCRNCWAASEARMRAAHPNEKISGRSRGLVREGGGWNGLIRCHEDLLSLPLRTKRPTIWALWTDLFHPDVPDQFIDRVYSVAALAREHIFLILTKRPQRMAEYWSTPRADLGWRWWQSRAYRKDGTSLGATKCGLMPETGIPNVLHGVTIENQAACERIENLLRVPGRRFLSVEPMLGPVDLSRVTGLDWIVCGGESGAEARPLRLGWVRELRDQSAEACVPLFFKQWGEWIPQSQLVPALVTLNTKGRPETPVHPWPGEPPSWRVAKARAGRLLDGREHLTMPPLLFS